ncbi:MAG TPA: septum formation initiator family protein [Desulfatiglandales bacterium]|nr:septum formation initiator family protein [Desulfatiglandales bacterium]
MGLDKKEFIKIFCLVLFFLGLIVIWLTFGDRGFIHLFRMEKERQAHAERIRVLEEENQKLLKEIERLRSDKAYVESEARKELGLLRENEVIYRFEEERDRTEQGK